MTFGPIPEEASFLVPLGNTILRRFFLQRWLYVVANGLNLKVVITHIF
tara:strand:+ start:4294 stop:4437 length:144 start_codon:yes stop_codon:yes gene_type:complete